MSDEDLESKISILRKRVRGLFSNIQKGLTDIYQEDENYIKLGLSISKAKEIAVNKLEKYIKSHRTDVKIREAEKKDIAKINQIYHESWNASHLPMKEVTEDLFMEIFEDDDTKFIIAELDSKDVGFILVEFNKLNKEIGLISGLGIVPEYQGRGLGKYLAFEAWNFFRDKGIKELRCEVYKENKVAISFIKSLGFEEYGTSDGIYTLK
ncbi:MAG: N-acetyltransferase [Promethearchaeota archaeon]|nr:MAG: N-acetyltransferase [Candidatus Lokiarchaeota archaeon]